MTRILSLDPGHTTGIAIYNADGVLELSMAAPLIGVYARGFLSKLTGIAQPDKVLLEGLPMSHVDKTTQSLWSFLHHWFTIAGYETVVVNPSQWKGLAERVEIPGQHARDAATMAKWYIKSQESKVKA